MFRQYPLEAPGADGWTPLMLRQLSEPAVQTVLDFFRACELIADWPAQFAMNLIVLLPESVKRERPIALLHILYRAYVRFRWPLVARCQRLYAGLGTWDKATPGWGFWTLPSPDLSVEKQPAVTRSICVRSVLAWRRFMTGAASLI